MNDKIDFNQKLILFKEKIYHNFNCEKLLAPVMKINGKIKEVLTYKLDFTRDKQENIFRNCDKETQQNIINTIQNFINSKSLSVWEVTEERRFENNNYTYYVRGIENN